MDNEIFVSVCMITYNHAKYISQAIEGVLLQKTNFLFELVISDDCSSDDTRTICLHYHSLYPHIIRLRLPQKNEGVMSNLTNTIHSCKGKYIALCEGDDYWIDPLKLQKQVDILNSNDNIGFVYTNFQIVDSENNLVEYSDIVKKQLKRSKSGFLLSSLMHNNFPQTLTVMFKKELISGIESYYQYIYDWPLSIHICGQCESVFLKDITGCYRINPNGVMASNILIKNDYRGGSTLSGAFKAYLDGVYLYTTKFDRLFIRLRIYYRVLYGLLSDVDGVSDRLRNDFFFKMQLTLKSIFKI